MCGARVLVGSAADWATQGNGPHAPSRRIKPQLQIRAGAEKSTDMHEIINRYRKLGITRLILRCAVAFAMLVMYLEH